MLKRPSSTGASPERKASRVISEVEHPLICSLPPTCAPPQNRPTPLASVRDLEAHYATYHAHVCEATRCGCVFPDERLLELHQRECHDPLAAIAKERGEKIFACHLQTCSKLFQNPKARRLHLIQAHRYPKEYFFAVTNKGVGGLLKKWGEGASMIRGNWKKREPLNEDAEDVEEDEDEEPETMDVTETTKERELTSHTTRRKSAADATTDDDSAVDALANSMTSLSLVPENIRFGRGGKNGGFERGRRDNRRMDADSDEASYKRENPHPPTHPTGRGRARGIIPILSRGGPGRGRGRIFPPRGVHLRGRGRGTRGGL